MSLEKGTVYLVGAGPGDYRLITLRGLDCIRNADVIVYDRLVNPVLLSYARSDVEFIYVGKSSDRHTMKQDEINTVLVLEAKKGKSVVRLKGGDPFVFGRGGEEAEFLLDNNVIFEVVPGISSSISAPAYAGIPVTHRDMASSFAVITGHEADDKNSDSSINWEKISTGCDTLVFLMGLQNLPSIVNNLIKNGRDPHEPIALIQSGTTPDQRLLIGNLSNIVEKAELEKFSPPTISVVGKVASLGNRLAWFGKKPLSGKRIIITRSLHQAQKMVDLITDLGGEPLTFPTIEIVPPTQSEPMDKSINNIEKYSWLIFTSVNGVSAFLDRMRYLHKDIRSLKDIKICSIGPKTKEELEKHGLVTDYTPESYTSQELSSGLKDILKAGERILVPRAEIAPDSFSELRDMGFDIDEVPAYKTIQGSGNIELVRELFHNRKINILTFSSSSTVINFVEMMKSNNLHELLEGVIIACIGPVTASTASNLGIPVHIVANEYTVEGLITSILDYYSNDKRDK
ncbi:MAG: uroporphyrinogen methyltransferase / synthase [Candidatus Poribacteria bacterium]|nr:uroporphyrinogen methyltransferase / synthase [Candidatus Poribacteria bacterium]